MTPKTFESEHAIREHLSGLLSSTAFAQVDRLKRFLRYVVEETVACRSEKLKEYSIGVEVFDRETSFDPRTDPIVRVQARRLRARLTRYYRRRTPRRDPNRTAQGQLRTGVSPPQRANSETYSRNSSCQPQHHHGTSLRRPQPQRRHGLFL